MGAVARFDRCAIEVLFSGWGVSSALSHSLCRGGGSGQGVWNGSRHTLTVRGRGNFTKFTIEQMCFISSWGRFFLRVGGFGGECEGERLFHGLPRSVRFLGHCGQLCLFVGVGFLLFHYFFASIAENFDVLCGSARYTARGADVFSG